MTHTTMSPEPLFGVLIAFPQTILNLPPAMCAKITSCRLLATLGTLALVAILMRSPSQGAAPTAPAVDYSRQILPLLADNCFACHGPDEKKRKAKLRLDTKEGLLGELKSGSRAVVPGKSAESALVERICSTDDSELMPPPKSGKKLTPQQIAVFKQWIDQGAQWSSHWAFIAPKLSPLPAIKNALWPRNPIDYFILARLEAVGLQPSAETDKEKLVRRVTLDLTGLPPTPAEIDTFLADRSANAFEKVVDRLLQSPRFGEHMARIWLDAARYGDTHGLHLDNYREMWPYRDWVVRAFNANKPINQFIIEQLAGDLLPNATLDQKIASGFNRCHVTTSEGGSIEEECYVRNVADRVDTTGTVFLGLTMGCVRCHDHKYDPLTTKDYYQMFAFFNSLDNKPLDGNAAQHPPIARVANAEQLAAFNQIEQKVQAVRRAIDSVVAKTPYDESRAAKEPEQRKRGEFVWIDDAVPAGAKPSADGGVNGQWNFVTKPTHPVYSGEKSVRRSAEGLSQHLVENAAPGLRIGAGDKLFAYAYLDPAKPPKEVMLQWHSDGWKHRAYWGENLIDWGANDSPERRREGSLPANGQWVRLEVDAAQVGLKPGTIVNGWAFTQFGGTVYWDKAGLVTRTPQGEQPFDTLASWVQVQKAIGAAGLPKPIQQVLRIDRAKRTDKQQKQLRDYFVEYAYAPTRAMMAPLHRELAEIEKVRDRLDKQLPSTLVSDEMPTPRPAYILKRGEYDQRGAPVNRDTPAALPPLPANAPRNRLGFAQWLTAPNHPLTSRVLVNRFWQQLFGTGLVKTAEDFGTQGEPPSHSELLDWLAVQFQNDGWDIKKLMKLMVMSATYRQSSRVTAERFAKDPANRLLSRGPRFRLDAETLRDQALAVSGLMAPQIGGPGVKPPQPYGLWEAVGYVSSNTARFVADKGHEKVHRRSLYTFWKRTAPPPQMTSFDAPSREACMVRRERTNTPLQALLLLNDPQYVECARALAERTLHEGGSRPEQRLAYLFRLATARRPDAKEQFALLATFHEHLAEFQRNSAAAKELIAVGESSPDGTLNPSELAAWTMIANLVLNLDEVLNKG